VIQRQEGRSIHLQVLANGRHVRLGEVNEGILVVCAAAVATLRAAKL
jgi:hypothetical protein